MYDFDRRFEDDGRRMSKLQEIKTEVRGGRSFISQFMDCLKKEKHGNQKCDMVDCEKKAEMHYITKGTKRTACRGHYCKEDAVALWNAYGDRGQWSEKCI